MDESFGCAKWQWLGYDQIFVAVLKLALSPLYFHYWTEFASDDANLIPFFQQGPLRLVAFHSSPIKKSLQWRSAGRCDHFPCSYNIFYKRKIQRVSPGLLFSALLLLALLGHSALGQAGELWSRLNDRYQVRTTSQIRGEILIKHNGITKIRYDLLFRLINQLNLSQLPQCGIEQAKPVNWSSLGRLVGREDSCTACGDTSAYRLDCGRLISRLAFKLCSSSYRVKEQDFPHFDWWN